MHTGCCHAARAFSPVLFRVLHFFACARVCVPLVYLRVYTNVCRDSTTTISTGLRECKNGLGTCPYGGETHSGSHLVSLNPVLGGTPMSIRGKDDGYLTSMRRISSTYFFGNLTKRMCHQNEIFRTKEYRNIRYNLEILTFNLMHYTYIINLLCI